MRPQQTKGASRRPLVDVSDNTSPCHSPEADDATDYGLEFTTTQLTLQDVSNRRCSTMRKDTSTARRIRADANRTASSTGDENQSQTRSSPRTPQNIRQRQQKSIAPKGAPRGAQRRKMVRPINHQLKMEREIQRLQAHPGMLIPRLPFSRLVREILSDTGFEMRVTQGALQVMQESSELYITHRLQDSYLLTMHRSRVTLEVRDMALMALLCNTNRC